MRYGLAWFRGRKVTVMGLGLHGGGLGVASWLMRHGARVTVTDMKDAHALAEPVRALERAYARAARRPGAAVVRPRLVLGRHDERDLTDADMVIQNPGVPRDNPYIALAKKNGVPVETDVSLFFMLCPFPIAAVTGTKGKTTTTALLGAMCAAHDPRTVVAGNIRVSVMDVLDGLLALAAKGEPPAPVVLELSSWQVEGLRPHRMHPRVGAITNIMPDHLNRYRGIAHYAEAKRGLIASQSDEDTAVLNHDDPRVVRMAGKRHRVLWFSGGELPGGKDGCSVRRGMFRLSVAGEFRGVAPVSALKVPGPHNLGNVAAACAAAFAYGIPVTAIRKALRGFRGVSGRLETVRKARGVTFVNDTTATTPEASIAALNAFPGKGIVLIAGGADKALVFEGWGRAVADRVRHLVLFDGSATPKMEDALLAAGSSVPIGRARSMREAVAEAVRHARRGDVILLSPGCASFGLFVNEFDRGDRFVKEAGRLGDRGRLRP